MKTLFIPLDERPCNYLYPQYIAETSDIELITPSMEQLSCKKTSGEHRCFVELHV